MLDMAVERAEDEGTVRAVRTEQRKIDEDSEKLARDRSKVSSSYWWTLMARSAYALTGVIKTAICKRAT